MLEEHLIGSPPWICGTVVHVLVGVPILHLYARISSLQPIHLPHTPPQLVNLPLHGGQIELTISHPIAILSNNSNSRHAPHFQNQGPNEKRREGVEDPIIAHVRSQQHSSSRLLSPDKANHISIPIRNLNHPITSNHHHNPTLDVRTSVVPSVYGSLASPADIGSVHQTRARCYHTLPQIPNLIKHPYTIPVFSNAGCRPYDHDRNLFAYL